MSVVSANNNALSAISALPSAVAGGGLNLISTQTASSSATLSFTSGIDSTYKKYVFKFINIHPATDEAHFTVGFRDGGTAYDAVKTTTYILSYHAEDDSETSLAYNAASDLAQGTGFQRILHGVGNGNDESASGYLHLFDPASTTFVKHFTAAGSSYNAGSYEYTTYVAGYNNVTAAIDGVQFKMSSGNIDSGVVKLYGIS